MKKTLLTILIASACYYANAQQTNTFPSTGRVGIGTLDPPQNLTVSNNGAEGFEVFLGQPTGIVGLQSYNRATRAYSTMEFDAANYTFMQGRFGIGTKTPLQNFVVSNKGAEGLEVYLDQPSGVVGLQSYNRISNVFTKMEFNATNFTFLQGNIGIGTQDTRGYKLAVAGNVIAESVTVKLQSAWPDYVFKPEYYLPSLKDVKAFIDEHHHLPEMPSEKEVSKNGLELGQMDRLLTKKIEELTLYMIDLKKDNEKLNKENKDLKLAQQAINTRLKRHHIN